MSNRGHATLPLLAVLSTLLLPGCAAERSARTLSAPVIEALPARNWTAGAMVAAANPLAANAGLDILKAGGSAIDAAIAVQAVLGLVEPQSSGIGGGAFLLHYDAATGDVVAYDGREIAPAASSPDMFLQNHEPLDFLTAVRSGRSIGVPGVVAMLELAHREQGRMPWSQTWQAAIQLAEEGYAVPPRMAAVIRQSWSRLTPEARGALSIDGSTPLNRGDRVRNPEYAATLRVIAAQGAQGFYQGPIADAIVAAAAREPLPGTLSHEDLRRYRANKLEPVCRGYRIYLVCGMGPPSSGGVAVLSVLGTLEPFDMRATGPGTVLGWHYFLEAQRLAYADRDKYVADDRYVSVPLTGLLDPAYLRSRSAAIRPDAVMQDVVAGNPPGALPRAADDSGGSTGTSHLVVVDTRGNVVSMTTTIEAPFGSQRRAGGFFLNNQLTDFSFRVTDGQNRPIANAPAPGKKPRSSMSPTIVFEHGGFRYAVGSPGGNAIIAYVAKALVATLDWRMDPQAAVDLPNFIARGAPIAEESRVDARLLTELKALGHAFRQGGGEGSGLHAVLLTDQGTLQGAADSRRDGVALDYRP